MKLNLGCGKRWRMPGYTGVDIVPAPGIVDVVADITKPMRMFESATASEIMVIHFWEHIYRWECDYVIEEWKRILKPGGLLVMEMPNIIKCCHNLINNISSPKAEADQLHMWGFYGDPRRQDPLMMHRWGWSPNSLRDFLQAHGFIKIQELTPQFHDIGKNIRDMRMEARKPERV